MTHIRTKSRPIFGAMFGFFVGVCFTLFFVLIRVVSGPGDMEMKYGFSPFQVGYLYLGGGIVGGAIAGTLLPLAQDRVGAMVVGAAGAFPVYLGADLLIGAGGSGSLDLFGPTLLSLIVGGAVGWIVWRPFPPDKKPD